jgi:hypothetical protein
LLKNETTTWKIGLVRSQEIRIPERQANMMRSRVRVFLLGACALTLACGNSTTPSSDLSDVVQDVPSEDAPDSVVPDTETDVKPSDGNGPDTEPDVVNTAVCINDDECTLTQYDAVVTDTEECFQISDACPVCSNWAVTKTIQAERDAAWDQYCTEWYAENPCPDPGCSSPGTPICVEGACTLNPAQPVECDTNVDCDTDPHQCPQSLIPINKNGCWGCAYQDTCTCSDGNPVVSAMEAPNCPEMLELAAQEGAFYCVDPMTCEPQGSISDQPCTANEECTISEYGTVVTNADECDCIECPWFPTSVAAHENRKAAWDTYCGGLTLNCPELGECIPPGQAACLEGKCGVDATPPATLCDEGASLVCGDELGEDPNTLYDCNENDPVLEEVCEYGCKPGTVDESATCETSACSADITCDDPEPFCVPPLVLANKSGCWGCAFPETCSCSDSELAECKLPPPECPENLELAIQDPGNGKPCYVCVDPITCESLEQNN